MHFTTSQVESLAPKPTAYKAGEKLSNDQLWKTHGLSDRAMWGTIMGSGSRPYFAQIDLQELAYKCSCPSRQFPCKHALGLMLMYAKVGREDLQTEPEWVEDWVNKRRKSAEPKPEVELTEEEVEKRQVAKEKRVEDREALVDAGVQELELWLKDLLRAGLLELPNKPVRFFESMAARMIDAKASGLAGWVKALGKLDYGTQGNWYKESCAIIAKVNLIIQSWKNRAQLTEAWQDSIKNLIGWSQAPKELLSDDTAYALKDYWLVLGQERITNEGITVQRTWLYGLKNGKAMLDLTFGTSFSPLENSFIPEKILKAEVAYFSAHLPQRGIVRMVAETLDALPERPIFLDDIIALQLKLKALTKTFPWINNEAFLLRDIRIIVEDQRFLMIDGNSHYMPIYKSFDDIAFMRWILLTGNARVDISLVVKQDKILPLGVFMNDKYHSL